MENMEGKILEVLNDPGKMAEIMELAKGLGFSPNPEGTPAPQEDDMGSLLSSVMGLLQQSAIGDRKQEALVQALMPYLQPHRQEKLKKAMRLGKLSQVAMIAFRSYQD